MRGTGYWDSCLNCDLCDYGIYRMGTCDESHYYEQTQTGKFALQKSRNRG